MPRITRISDQASNPDRVSVFIDGQFCCGIRKRTFQGMNMKVGDEISCEELKEKESFYWKQSYGEAAWKKEKVRIDKVKNVIEAIDERLLVKVVGFGADTDQLIEKHPDEKGKPDLDVSSKQAPETVLIKVEVTGTERSRGSGYWVRPDKLEYAENHPEEDVWIVLHYAEPAELFIFIKPIAGKVYERHTIQIFEAGEIMCIFNDGDQELRSHDEFSQYIKNKFNLV
jgi:hypothetical protein